MLIGAAVCGLFSFGTGLAFSVWMLVIMRSGSGIGQATVGPTHNSLLSDWFPIGNRPRVFSFHRAANALGAFVGPLIAGLLAACDRLAGAVHRARRPAGVCWSCSGCAWSSRSGASQEREAMGVTATPCYTEEPPPSFAEAWRMVWKVESLRRIFYSLPFLAASLIGFVSLAALLYEQKFGLDERGPGVRRGRRRAGPAVGLVIGARFGTS